MNIIQAAKGLRESRNQSIELLHEEVSAAELRALARMLGVIEDVVYVSCGSAESLRIQVPVNQPIRSVPMGEKS